MKSFLTIGKKPLVKWGMIPDGILYKGVVPEGHSLAVCPSKGTVIIDVDRHGDKNGFYNIPKELIDELESTLNYPTKNAGRHYWFHYSGDQDLANKASGLGIDLRTHKGYVIWYPRDTGLLLDSISLIQDSSKELNKWLESLFGFVNK